jgi:hypothetical protein
MEVYDRLHAPTVVPRVKASWNHRTEGRLGSRNDLDILERIKISSSCRDSNPGLTTRIPVSTPTTSSLFPLPKSVVYINF